jgi:hypothetical protein
MAAVANNPSFAKKAGVPQSVGKEFNEADKSRKFSKGGDMKKMNMGGYAEGGMPMKMKDGKKVPAFLNKGGMAHEDVKMDKKMMQKAVNKHEGRLHKGSTMTKFSAGGSASKRADGVATKGKTKGTMIKMTKGGMAC